MMKTSLLLLSGLLVCLNVQSTQAESKVSAGSAMTDAAQSFLKSLSPAEMKQATRSFDDPARLDWHNIPKPQRKGLQVREMSPAQQKLCHQLLQAALSENGYEKSVHIMSLESNLLEGEKGLKGSPLRDPARYFLTIFGDPKHDSTWGWSFEGHHFSLNFVISKDKVTSETPSFWGACPATVQIFIEGGPKQGTRTLADEEQFGFDLVNALTAEQLAKAVIAEKAPADYRNAGKPQPPVANQEGLPGSEMTSAQQEILWNLLAAYNSHLAADVAAMRLEEIKAHGIDDVYFAWLGSTKPGAGHCYRVQGPTFVLELINVQPDPAGNPANHIHSVWRSLDHDFGVTAK